MFNKVIVAEDYESSSISVQKTLEELKINGSKYVYYCDDAFENIKRSAIEEKPFDLLITDLSFDEDHRPQKLKNGTDLISEIKKSFPDIKIIVFSIEKKPKIIGNLFENFRIDGFVGKSRNDVHELKKAIIAVFNNEKYLSSDHQFAIRKNSVELSSAELEILKLISSGIFQKDIPCYFKKNDIKPSSLSSVEKSINNMKETFGAKNNEQLIAICKDLGIL